MFGIGPAYLFLLRHRFPLGRRGNRRQDWLSAMATNLAVAALFGGLIWLVGTGPFLLVQLPITLAAGAAGVWLFYVQHQFERTYWAQTGSWSPEEAALRGSSHYHLPGALRWLTANIGVHHVHHLASRIPYYRLPKVLRDHPELADTSRITLRQSLGCVRLALWDETQKRLVSFREARRKADSATAA
jgi:omega-6 fatty acid desaturase (delta-12 desaturase)